MRLSTCNGALSIQTVRVYDENYSVGGSYGIYYFVEFDDFLSPPLHGRDGSKGRYRGHVGQKKWLSRTFERATAEVNAMAATLFKGAEFLIAESQSSDTLTPEKFTSEQKMIAEICEQFVVRDVLPQQKDIENQRFDLVVDLLRRCGDLGLLMIDVPKEFGGLELGKVTSALVQEKIAPAGSFALSYLGHTGIGTLPLVYYGTKLQKEKYLEKISTGEWISAFCLTEPDAGSDALGLNCTAVRSDDGRHYVLNGVKQFITNGGIADILTVFAKVDNQHITAFVVERSFEGVSSGPEEKKMGIHGSSTVQVRLDNVRVPIGNLLGEIGRGHKIAFNVLNISRLKLGAYAIGTAKEALTEAIRYAKTRKQFGVPIASFGAIQEKIAEMTAAIFAAESVVYRIAGMLDDRLEVIPKKAPNYYGLYVQGTEEYVIECAIAKVFSTEMLSSVVDEVVQIHGGYGYMQDYSAERHYRDARIHRIWEGTNEINRLLIVRCMLQSFAKRDSRLVSGSEEALKFQSPISQQAADAASTLARENALIGDLKRLFLYVYGMAEEQFGNMLDQQQEVSLCLADMMIQIFALESAIVRADSVVSLGNERASDSVMSAAKIIAYNAAEQALAAARKATFCLSKAYGEESIVARVNSFGSYDAYGLLQAIRQLARATIDAEKYVFECCNGSRKLQQLGVR